MSIFISHTRYTKILMVSENNTIVAANLSAVPAGFPFIIENCGGAYTGTLVDVLNRAVAALKPALNDVGLGLHSQHGFKALFKDGAMAPYIRDILQFIASARKVKGLSPNPFIPTAPRFTCVTPRTIKQYKFLKIDPWKLCNSPGAGVAFYLGDSSYIFLCSNFWKADIAPRPETKSCPSVIRNQFIGWGENLGNYLTYMIIHEMVHFYLGKYSLGIHTYPPEIYRINECVALDPATSALNPPNYQYYVASECSRFLLTGSGTE